MKLLKEILYKVPLLEVVGNTNMAVADLHFDSRKISNESLFVAIKGSASDGHEFINQAVQSGARSVICEELPAEMKEGVSYIKVKSSHKALGVLASNYYDQPSEQLKLVAVTGTNGKTTVTSLLHSLFSGLDKKSGLLSTVQIKVGRDIYPATHTTPDPLSINKYLRMMVDAGCKYCFMEASSHGIDQERIAGLKIAGAVFTNLSHDHLDYHPTFDDYLLAKKKLFDQLDKDAFALVNIDDKHGNNMLHHTKAQKIYYSLLNDSDYKIKIIEESIDGMLLQINNKEVWTKLIGKFNAYNIGAVYAVSQLLQVDELQSLTAISSLKAVDGRFQQIQSKDNVTAIVDYAHTPDALVNVLETIQKLRNGNEKIICVVGAGGNRDKTKRPLMANIAGKFSDQVLLTSDNPRHEEPEDILKDMESGIEKHLAQKYITIQDRKEAIKTASRLATAGDIILIAGKGHEKYQDIKGVKHHFDDLELITEFLNQR